MEILLPDWGQQVTLKKVSRTFNDYGDATETVTTETIWVIPVEFSSSRLAVQNFGEVNEETLIFYTNSSSPQMGDYINYNSVDWRIERVERLGNTYRLICQKNL